MITLINDLRLQTSREKDVPPTHEMICLGVTVNTWTMTLTVPEFRLKDLHDDLSRWLNKSHFIQQDLQQLLGKLVFITACVCPGRAFSCWLINALRVCHASPKRKAFSVNGSMRSDILWWKHFLDYYNGVSVIPTNRSYSLVTHALVHVEPFVLVNTSMCNYPVSSCSKISTSTSLNCSLS